MISISQKKLIKSLSLKKYREREGLFVAEGEKLVRDLMRGGLTPRLVVSCVEVADMECVLASERDMHDISQLKTAPNMLALFPKPEARELNIDAHALTLVLDEIQDPGNMGTIIRTADWFGIHDIVCSRTCADVYGSKTVQATMGAIARVRAMECDLDELFARNASEWHMPVYGTLLEGENIYDAELSAAGLIVMGNEGKGLHKEFIPQLTHKLFIPNYPAGAPTSESLNVAAATAIVCSEFRRRRVS